VQELQAIAQGSTRDAFTFPTSMGMNTSLTLLDSLMTQYQISNHDLVEAAPGQLSHKNVQKARTGKRPVTDAVARQITGALRSVLQAGIFINDSESAYFPEDIPSVRQLFPTYPRGKAVVPESTKSVDAGEETEEDVDEA
jgi:hypothetical protein